MKDLILILFIFGLWFCLKQTISYIAEKNDKWQPKVIAVLIWPTTAILTLFVFIGFIILFALELAWYCLPFYLVHKIFKHKESF